MENLYISSLTGSILKMYRHLSGGYEELHKEEQIKKLKIIRENMKIIPPLLDIGCGTGISTDFFKVKSVGIDNCREMIEKGGKNLKYADAEKLPFKDKSFNTVISVTAFHNIKNMEKALKEAIRVSKNSNICISFLKRSKRLNEFSKLFSKYFKNYKEIEEEKDIIFINKNKVAQLRILKQITSKSKLTEKDALELGRKINNSLHKRYTN